MYLGIDIGTSGTKAVLINDRGKIVADAHAEYPCYHPRPLWSEQDPEDWWRGTVQSVRTVVATAKLRPTDVRAIGLSGQMHGSVFLDRRGRVIRRALLWNDQRTFSECQEIETRAGGRAALIRMVANPALTGFTAPKILWLRNHEPRHFSRLAKVLLPKDEIRRRLTGEYATDVSDASGTLLLDVAKRKWSRLLLSRLDLDESLLSPCYESDQVTGTLTLPAATELGLSTRCLVVAGAGDCAANAIGTGVVRSGMVSTSIGTSGVVFAHSDQVQIDPRGRLHTFCHAVPGKWHLMGVTLAAGGSLQWFADQLCRSAATNDHDLWEQLGQEASAVPAGSEGLFFLPYLAGERTPHADPDARGSFIGLTLKHTRGHMTRAIMEGVTYSLRECLEIIRELHVPIRQIRASGGGAKSMLWRQLQADIMGRKVVTINAEEGPAYGVALLAAVAGGAFKDIHEACATTLQVTSETSPHRGTKRRYDAGLVVYQALYQSLRKDFKAIARLS